MALLTVDPHVSPGYTSSRLPWPCKYSHRWTHSPVKGCTAVGGRLRWPEYTSPEGDGPRVKQKVWEWQVRFPVGKGHISSDLHNAIPETSGRRPMTSRVKKAVGESSIGYCMLLVINRHDCDLERSVCFLFSVLCCIVMSLSSETLWTSFYSLVKIWMG